MQINTDIILKNGIRAIARQNTGLHQFNVGFYFRAGTVYESSKTNGISHLVEHLFFRNLNGIPQKELYYRMEKIGTTMRGITYDNFVRFDMTVSQKYFNDSIEIIRQLLLGYEWTREDIKSEKAVVKKQIEFKPQNSFRKFVDFNYFTGTKLKMPIMGSENLIDRLSVAKINEWKDKFFNTNNVCCILTGNFSDDNYNDFIENLEVIKASLHAAPVKESAIPENFCARSIESDIIVDTDWEISDISITFDINSSEISIYCVDLLSSILGEGAGSGLSLILREEEFLTDEIYSRIDTFPDIKRLTIEFSVQNYDLEKSLEIVFSKIVKLKNSILQEDLEASITFFTENQKFIYDSPREYNFYLGWDGFVQEKDIEIERISEQYRNITIEELHTVADQLFSSKNLIMTITNNKTIYKKSKLKKLVQTFRNKIDDFNDGSKSAERNCVRGKSRCI